MKDLHAFSKEHNEALESQMLLFTNNLDSPQILKESMSYSLQAGGKRIRPLLVFAVLSAYGKETMIGLPAAVAIEMIHTYSLIHDDLPTMDNDDLRRGKPTNHKVFGDATAILAGDALLTYSFQVLAQIDHEGVTPAMKLELIEMISRAAGAEGMVGGQVADMEGEEKHLTLAELEYIHKHKTGKLLTASVLSGAILAAADEQERRNWLEFSEHLGLAFQIQDDILDVVGSEELIGKPVGSDQDNQKSTYPALLTLEGARGKLKEHIACAKSALNQLGLDVKLLHEITDMIASRDH